MPIYSDVIARLDEKSVQETLRALESQFESGGSNLGETFSRAFSAAGSNFSAGLSDGIRQTIGDMGSLGTAAESALGRIPVGAAAAATGIGLIAVAAVQVGQALYDVGERFDAVSDRIAARTNTLGDDMDKLNETLRASFRNSASSLEEVGAVLTGVAQSLHLTGQAAVEVTNQIDDFNRSTGDSLNIRNLGRVLAQFGVDAGQAGNTIDMLYTASAKSGAPINELVTNLSNAGPSARNLGLTLGELTNLFGKFEEGGIEAGRAQMALNNAAKVFADAGIPLQTGLADTITQLDGFIDAGNEAAAVDLAGTVFGERGAQRFVDLIRNGKLSVQDLNTELTGTQGAIEKQSEATKDWSENWATLKNRVTDLAQEIGGPLFDALNDALGVLNDLLADPWTSGGGRNVSTGAPMSPAAPFTPGNLIPGGTAPNQVSTGPGGAGLAAQFPWLSPSLNMPTPGPGDIRQPQDVAGAVANSGGGSGSSGPQIPYPADYGQPPRPGETVEQWQHRMQVMDAQHDVAEKQAALTQLESSNTADQNALIKARNDLINAQIRQTQVENQQTASAAQQAAQVPMPAGYGAAPRPGETAQQYAAEQSMYEAQHKTAEARARLQQVETSATATVEDLVKARNDLAKAETDEHQAQLRLSESASKASDQLGEVGAQIDADFGISKGLPGIVENITKMLAGFAAAPVIGALTGAQAGLGYKPGDAGSGLVGILASSGAFGSQYVRGQSADAQVSMPGAASSAPSSASYSAAAALPGESPREFAHRVMMPFWQSQGLEVGDHAADKYGEHQNGALDVMVPNLAVGSKVLQQALSDPNVYGAIFDNKTYGYGQGSAPRDYSAGHTGDPTQDHQDHVHIWYKPGSGGNVNPAGGGLPGLGGIMPASSGTLGGQSIPLPLPVTIVGGMAGTVPGLPGLDTSAPPLSPSTPSTAPGTSSSRPGGGGGGGGLSPGIAGLFPGLTGASTPGPSSGGLFGVPGAAAAPAPSGGGGGGGGAPASSFFPGLGGPPQSLPGLGLPSPGGGPDPSSTLIGGLAPPQGSGGGFSGMGGGILGAALGAASSGAGMAASAAAGGMDGGAGGAAASAAMQIGVQLLNRAVAQGGQVAGIAASGLMETFLPFGASELAQNSWLTKIVGGIVGARPVLPNLAGGAGKKAPEGLTPEQAAQFKDRGGPTPEDVAGDPAKAGGGGGGGGGRTVNNNVTVNNQRPTEDGTGRDVTWHLGQMYSGPGQ
ncbi:MAG TPA: phage tail tape measure protein [Mycolicibacterium fallax]|nr:phage tail tape measure protein [Mycolicibacterium fallax]